MTSLTLFELLQPESCPFCHNILVLRMCWYNSTLKQSCHISKDGLFKFNNVSICLEEPLLNVYWLGDDPTKIYSLEEEQKHSDNYHFVKECFKCSHRYCIYTSELVFFDGYINNLSIEKVGFQVSASDNENFIVTQDYQTNKTKVVFSKLKESYSGILLPDNTNMELPMIKINFDEPDKIINRIKTLTILS